MLRRGPEPAGSDDRAKKEEVTLGPPDPVLDLAAAAEGDADPAELGVLLDRAAALGREAEGLAAVRQSVLGRSDRQEAALWLGERLSERGEQGPARTVLEPLIAGSLPDPRAHMLLGEMAEGEGNRERALFHYEQVLARDLDYPGASERAGRLRDRPVNPAMRAHATLLSDGALTRGRYRIERELGRGGAGTVFLARDIQLDRTVALKLYHRRGRAERDRLRVEASTPARLEHPGVIRVFDMDEGLSAIAMEWLEGGSLRAALDRGDVTAAAATRFMRSAVAALRYVHEKGWVHRDLKPSNMLIRDAGRVVLTDFGLACRAGEAPPGRSGEGGEGTLKYMPPEQRAGAPAEPSADVHALGATLAELADALGLPAWRELSQLSTRPDPRTRPSLSWLDAQLDNGG